jgi:hypothetical protein
MASKTPTRREIASPGPANQPGAAPLGVTINPVTNNLTLNPSDTLDESITVTIPKGNNFKNFNLVPSASIAGFIAWISRPAEMEESHGHFAVG